LAHATNRTQITANIIEPKTMFRISSVLASTVV
jgi:hypothetical protein